MPKKISEDINSINEKYTKEKEKEQLIKTKNNKNLSKNYKKLPSRTASGYKYKKNNNIKLGLIRGPWSVQEDKLLTQWVDKNGPKKWNECSEYIQGRTGKQCREHWNNCLNPNLIKGEWTVEEDFLIMYFYQKCNGSWKRIINLFKGRTENSIKNRFFSQLRKIAISNLGPSEKRYSSKMKLEDLLNYLDIGISNSKRKYLNEKKYSEDELNDFLKNMEKKIIFNKKKEKESIQGEENEINDTYISSNLSNLENSQNLLIKENKKKSLFNKKRKREEEEEDKDEDEEIPIFNSIEKRIQNDEIDNIENNISNDNNNSENNNINNKNIDNNIDNKNPINEIKEDTVKFKPNNNIDINKQNELKDINEDTNIKNQQLTNSENITNDNNINKELIKKNSINIFNNNNFISNNSIVDPFQNNFSIFDNNEYNTHNDIFLYENKNSIFRHIDSLSLSDIQNYIPCNVSNNTTKQSSNFLNGNKILENDIENPFTLTKENEYKINQNYFF